jgi:hypothetical protein
MLLGASRKGFLGKIVGGACAVTHCISARDGVTHATHRHCNRRSRNQAEAARLGHCRDVDRRGGRYARAAKPFVLAILF